MKYFRLVIANSLIVIMLMSCGTGSKLSKMETTGDNAYQQENYAVALTAYENVIADCRANDREAECPVYTRAGISALRTDNLTKAIEYLQNAVYTPFANEDTYYYLGRAYRKIDNLSKEIMTLEDYLEKYPEGKYAGEIRQRLFETYMESENWEKAHAIWTTLSENMKTETAMQKHWFRLNCEVESSEDCESLAENLLEQDPDYVPALEFLGEKYFWKAENRYQAEMEAYEKNRTRKQYARLLKALDEITADFKIALGYYDKLYEMDPDAKYAQYLSNIYLRFDNREKSDYYRKKAKQ